MAQLLYLRPGNDELETRDIGEEDQAPPKHDRAYYYRAFHAHLSARDRNDTIRINAAGCGPSGRSPPDFPCLSEAADPAAGSILPGIIRYLG